jgi:hypothetical protein
VEESENKSETAIKETKTFIKKEITILDKLLNKSGSLEDPIQFTCISLTYKLILGDKISTTHLTFRASTASQAIFVPHSIQQARVGGWSSLLNFPRECIGIKIIYTPEILLLAVNSQGTMCILL